MIDLPELLAQGKLSSSSEGYFFRNECVILYPAVNDTSKLVFFIVLFPSILIDRLIRLFLKELVIILFSSHREIIQIELEFSPLLSF